MSILIKDMAMPKSCWDCPMVSGYELADERKAQYSTIRCRLTNKRRPIGEPIADDCPLVELPPHGRLIDADAFEKDCRKLFCHDCDNYNGVKCHACWVDDMLGEVTDAPTIIESEEKE